MVPDVNDVRVRVLLRLRAFPLFVNPPPAVTTRPSTYDFVAGSVALTRVESDRPIVLPFVKVRGVETEIGGCTFVVASEIWFLPSSSNPQPTLKGRLSSIRPLK